MVTTNVVSGRYMVKTSGAQHLRLYVEAWEATPGGNERRVSYAIPVANTLISLPERSSEQVELLITAQREILDARKAAADPGWTLAANLLGNVYRERARRRPEAEAEARTADLLEALHLYVEAWEATPGGNERRVSYAVDVANTLNSLPERSSEQVELLITAQREILDARQAAADPEWTLVANLLGDAYRERAENRADQQGREGDLAQALAVYVEAWQSIPIGDDRRFDLAIDIANTRVVRAAIGGLDVAMELEETERMISSEASNKPRDSSKYRDLLPVLSARLRRQEWWSDAEEMY